MLRLYLVRHGWTAWHSERRVAGWANIPLNGRGEIEARAAGQWLAGRLRQRPAVLLSSPVERAHQTASLIARAFDPPMPVELDPGLADTRVPEWEGRLVDDIVANDPAWADFYQGPADFRFPGGETGREVQARVVKVVEALLERSHDGPAVLVAHADPLRALIAHYLGLDANNYYRLRIDCGSISRLSLYPPGSSRRVPLAQLDVLNLTEHLRL